MLINLNKNNIKFSIKLIIVLFALSCGKKRELIQTQNISSIAISTIKNNFLDDTIYRRITNSDSIKLIINQLNQANKESIKFYPNYKIKIFYLNGQNKTILCSGSSIRVSSHTYRMSNKIKNLIMENN